jgi:EAL domain-containing protein (putative c-di-GMP-specific phosphodiesterase class I)
VETLYDPITRLPKAELFEEILRHAIRHNRRHDRILALVRLTVALGDPGGEELSPELLQMAAARIKDTIRENDLAGSLEGGEFAVVFNDLITPGDVDRAVQRIFEDLQRPFERNGRRVRLTGTAGISLYPINGHETGKLMDQAARAHAGVKAGPIRYRFVSADINRTAIDRLALRESMEEALERRQLQVFYLPQFDLSTDTITGLEALLKWQHPQLGLLPARRWVPLADELKKIHDISRFVLESVGRDEAEWRQTGAEPMDLMINFCTSECLSPNYAKRIRRIIKAAGIDPRRLIFEFSEDCMGYRAANAWQSLTELARMGIRISIDNYGRGYTNVIQLRSWPLTCLKIDRVLIAGIVEDADNREAVRAIIDLGHALKLKVGANGAETADHLAVLKNLGCDLAQGFALGQPCDFATACHRAPARCPVPPSTEGIGGAET